MRQVLVNSKVIIMHKIVTMITSTMLVFAVNSAHAGETPADSDCPDKATDGDPRQLVSMPEQTRQMMQADMLDHLAALNEILTRLANDELAAAADVAENRLGRGSMGRHHGTGMGPGRYMPFEMRKLGRSMHFAASDFARIAEQGDRQGAYAALQKVTNACVACHYSFRIQ